MKETDQIPRRRFIKTFAFGTAFSSVLGESWTGHFLGEALATSGATPGTIRLKVSDYTALANPNGSVRLAMNPVNPPPDNKPNGSFYPVIVNRLAATGDAQFIALNSKCSHMDCAVGAFGALLPNLSLCPCHQSSYNIRGVVTSGPALATGNLTPLVSRYDGVSRLEIDVPGLGYAVTGTVVPSTQNPDGRYRLNFPTFRNAPYEVFHLERLGTAMARIPFAITQNGTANLTGLTGDGAPKTVYVNRTAPAGFYRVAIKIAAG